jgi:hypothetical protein
MHVQRWTGKCVNQRQSVTEVLINPIIRKRTRYFRHAYHPTRDTLVSEVGGSDRIGFISSGYDRKYVKIWCQNSSQFIDCTELLDKVISSHKLVTKLLDSTEVCITGL